MKRFIALHPNGATYQNLGGKIESNDLGQAREATKRAVQRLGSALIVFDTKRVRNVLWIAPTKQSVS